MTLEELLKAPARFAREMADVDAAEMIERLRGYEVVVVAPSLENPKSTYNVRDASIIHDEKRFMLWLS